MNYDLDMPPYIQEMADWLDDRKKVHQCNFDHACLGAEIMLAMQRSAVEGGQVALPLASGADEQALLKAKAGRPPGARLLRAEQEGIRAGLNAPLPRSAGLRPGALGRVILSAPGRRPALRWRGEFATAP